MRIVLDTAILVRATAKAIGPARLLLERIAAGGHELFMSPFLLEETERVLNYPADSGTVWSEPGRDPRTRRFPSCGRRNSGPGSR